jgi:putative transposase
MRLSRFTEEQIIGMLKEQEAGAATADVCRKHGISSPTFYKFKAKYGGMDVSDARRLKTLEDENARLKKLLAEKLLDNAILKGVAAKNGDVRSEAEGGSSCLRGACGEPPSGVPGLEDRSLYGALPEHPSRR